MLLCLSLDTTLVFCSSMKHAPLNESHSTIEFCDTIYLAKAAHLCSLRGVLLMLFRMATMKAYERPIVHRLSKRMRNIYFTVMAESGFLGNPT